MKTINLHIYADGQTKDVQVRAYDMQHAVDILFSDTYRAFNSCYILQDGKCLSKTKQVGEKNLYITHKYEIKNGEINRFWGHYIVGLDDAFDDFVTR